MQTVYTATAEPVAVEVAYPTEETIQTWLIAKVAEQLGIDPASIDVQDPFDNYGLGSTEAVIISGDLERWLNRQFSATLLWDYPTIEILAQYLASEWDG